MDTADLCCSICPKRPVFSDQSHLLTHISSKGHLAHHFNAQVRASNDLAMEHTLKRYDEWYRKHDIGKLLSQRLETKESKRQRASLPPSKKVFLEDFDYESPPCPLPYMSGLFESNGSCIDPNLESCGNKDQHLPDANQCGTSNRVPLARMCEPDYGIGMDSYYDGIAPQKEFEATRGLFDLKYSGSPAWASGFQHLPSLQQGIDYINDASKATHRSRPASTASHSRHTSTTSSVFERDTGSDFHRLKGIVWPGMDLFDTANEESKRRRNQKKDKAALDKLAEDSDAIQPTETIYFYPSWELKKSRFISGNVESSPLAPVSPVVKRNMARRRPLDELDPNVPIKRRKTRGQKLANRKLGGTRTWKRNAAFESDNEIIDLMQPFQPLNMGRKRAFKVFEDDSPTPKLCSPGREIPTDAPFLQSPPIYRARGPETAASKVLSPTIQSYSPGSHGMVSGLLYNTPKPSSKTSFKKLPQGSPPFYPRPSPDTRDLKLPQIITPRRMFLHSPARYNSTVIDTQLGTELFAYPHGETTAYSPLGLGLSTMFSYSQSITPRCSPLRTTQSRFSPSERASKSKREGHLRESPSYKIEPGYVEPESHFFV